jgi:hypothetical protein
MPRNSVFGVAVTALVFVACWCASSNAADQPFEAIVIGAEADAVAQTAALELRAFFADRGLGRIPVYSALEASLDPERYSELKAALQQIHVDVGEGKVSAEPDGKARIVLKVDGSAPWVADEERMQGGESYRILHRDGNLEITGSESRALVQAVFWLEDQWNSGASWIPDALPVVRHARLQFRVGMPYFTEAGEVTDEYLRFMARSGYNGIYLAFHPYLKYIQDPLFFPISHIFRSRDFVNTPDHEQLVTYVNDVFKRAGRYGLDGYLYVMEPWGGDTEFLATHPEAVGSFREPRLTSPLCLDQPVVLAYLENLAAELAQNVPGLDGLFIMNEDGTTICDETCPNSVGTRGERRARLFSSIGKGLHRVRPDIRMVAYTWWWDPEDFAAVIPSLPSGSLVCTRTSTNAPFELGPDWKGTPQDVSVLVDGPGRDFLEAVQLAKDREIHVVDMLTVSNGHELITMPDLPAPDRFARKIDVVEDAGGAGWFAYDCGGVTDNLAAAAMAKALWAPAPPMAQLLAELAESLYGEAGADDAVKGWLRCSEALGLFPVELDFEDMEAGAGTGSSSGAAVSAMLPAVPLSVKHADVYAAGGLGGGARGDFYARREIMLNYLRPLVAGLEEGLEHLRAAASAASHELKPGALRNLGIAEATACCFRSGIHMLEFLDALDAAPGASEAAQREGLAERVRALVAAEIRNVETLLDVVERDPRMFYCACTKYFHPMYLSQGFLNEGYLSEGMSIPEILRKKLATMRNEDYGAELNVRFFHSSGDNQS